MKSTFVLFLLLTSTVSWGAPKDHILSVKERLRLSLWIEGLEDQKAQEQALKKQQLLPEELERALKKI